MTHFENPPRVSDFFQESWRFLQHLQESLQLCRSFLKNLTRRGLLMAYIDMLKTQERVNAKFVKYLRDEIFELRAEHGGNIFRVFFIFDDGNVVMLFNGFQKKTQKTPQSEINKAIQIKKEYYAGKK